MLPKNSKHFVIPTAEKLGINVNIVEDVITSYYSELRKSLVNCDHHTYQIEGLGIFKVKLRELPKLLARYYKHVEVLKTETFNQMVLKKDIENKLARLQHLQRIINEEHKRKKEHLEKKHESKINTTLEK